MRVEETWWLRGQPSFVCRGVVHCSASCLDMSQQSQTSNGSIEPMLSQETFNEVFSSIHQLWNQQDLQRIQTEGQLAPTSVHIGDINENFEMNLDCSSFLRQEVEIPSLMQDQSFTRTIFKTEEEALRQQPAALKQNSFKQEPQDNSFMPIPSAMATPPPEQSPIPQPLIVSTTDFPGMYGFHIGFPPEKAPPTKSVQWTYSPSLEKLFLKMRCIAPMRLKLRVFPPAPGFYVRVMVIYRQPEYYREIVERCPNHITKHKDGHHAPKHLLRCENPQTVYATCPETGRHSLKIPLGAPDAGSDFVTEMFQFMCFSSCPGGLNRRPILVVFTLEYGNQVLGRKAQNVRICACPGRDRTNEEIAESKKQKKRDALAAAMNPEGTQPVRTSTPNTTPSPAQEEASVPHTAADEEEASTSRAAEKNSKIQVPRLSKKRSCAYLSTGFEVRQINVDRNPLKKLKPEEEETFILRVKGREKYEMLLKIKESLDLMDLVPQAQIDSYRRSCPPCGKSKSPQNSENTDSQNSTDSQADDVDGTPTFSQLSRSDSGSSYQSPTSSQQSSGGQTGINAVRFTLRRTVSLEKKGYYVDPVDCQSSFERIEN